MADAEYQRLRRAAIKAGTHTKRTPLTPAEHMRLYRQRKKGGLPRVSEVLEPLDEYSGTEVLSDDELMDRVRARGRILTAMMRTHPSEWKQEWTCD